MFKSPIITLFLFSLLMISKISINVVENIFMSAFGAVFGLYITPTIWVFSCLVLTSINIDSKICGIKTDMSSRIVYCIFSLIYNPTPPLLLFSLVRLIMLWYPGRLRL